MSWRWQRLVFPAGVEPDDVAALLRTLGAEPRNGFVRRRPPVVLETVLGGRFVAWRIG